MDEQLTIEKIIKDLRLGTNTLKLSQKIEKFESREQFTEDLLRAIYAYRIGLRTQRYEKQAKFGLKKKLTDFDFTNILLPEGYGLEWFTQCRYIPEKINLIHLGNPGTGKTHLSIALGRRAAELGYRPFYRRTSKFVEELTAFFENGSLGAFKKRLNQFDVIILDEWGYVPVHVNGARLLADVLADCYEAKSVVLTTNLPIPEWNRVIGDERLIVSMVDRLVHHGLLIRHEGQSYRLSHSLMKSNPTSASVSNS